MGQNNLKYKSQQPIIVVGVGEDGKIPPQVLELEESVLGAIMLDKDAYDEVTGILEVGNFYKDAHNIIFESMSNLYRKSEPIDIMTVTDELRNMGKLDAVGGAYYVMQLTTRLSSGANVEFHARIVQEKHLAREVIKISGLALKKAYDETQDVHELIEGVENSYFNLTNRLGSQKSVMIGDIVRDIIQDIENFDPLKDTIGTSSGFYHFDHVIHGLQAPNLIIIAGRPGSGKSSFALNIAQYVTVKLSLPIVFYTYEMSAKELGNRFLSTEYEIPLEKIITKDKSVIPIIMNPNNYGNVMNGQLHIEDVAGVTITGIRSSVKKLKKKYGIQGVVVDYIQKVYVDKSNNFSNREGDVSEIASGLKLIAKELDIWVIALSQLNRDLEKRPSKRPQLSDLRESGAIEQDADIVAFIHRPEYYGIMTDENGESTEGLAEIIIAKNRNGDLKKIKQKWLGIYTKFKDIDNYQPVAYTEPKSHDDNPF